MMFAHVRLQPFHTQESEGHNLPPLTTPPQYSTINPWKPEKKKKKSPTG
jgi:hypothetical protein